MNGWEIMDNGFPWAYDRWSGLTYSDCCDEWNKSILIWC